MSTVMDERTRHARARVHAAAILDTPHVARGFVIADRHALVGTERRRLHGRTPVAAPAPTPPARGRRRLVIALVLLVQLGVLALLLVHPAFRVHTVEVTGGHLLNATTIDRIAGARPGGSIFTVDASAMERRLLADPWVQSATVETALPATLRITITERTAVLRVRRTGGDELVASGGATIAVAQIDAMRVPAVPVLEDRRPQAGGIPAALDPSLLAVLADTAATFPKAYGCAVASFQWTADGVLQIVTTSGWIAILGHIDDPDRVAGMPAQLAALASLKGRLNLLHPTFGYINLEDPLGPAVGGKPGPPQRAPSAAQLARPEAPPPAAPGPSAKPIPIVVGAAPAPAAAPAAPTAPPAAASGPTPIAVPGH